MAESLGSAVLTLSVDDSQYNAGLNRAKQTTEAAIGGLRSALAGLGVATSVGAAIAFVGKEITQLDSASAAVRTLGVDSVELGQRLRALSVELNNNVSTLALTQAAYDVASSGFASAADATQILRAAAAGAKGGFAEINDVASALTGVLNAYGLTASQASVLTDQFVQTQADGVITVRQYAAEIGNIASIAAASGISIQELNAAIATATLRGVPVAQTFTGLRQAISSIIKPSEQAKDLADSLGIQFNVGALKAKGFGGVLADVQAKTGGAADKIAILLGSVEAQAAVQPLLNDKLVKYNELLDRQAKAAGAAANASDTNAKTISGGLAQIGNGFSNLATTLDTALTPLLSGFIQSLNDILVKLNQVAALSPENVLKRDKEAADIVQSAIGPLGGSGFFGAVSVKFNGKTYKGSATGVKESILQDLLRQDLAKATTPTASTAAAKPTPLPTPGPTNAKTEEEKKRLEAIREASIELQRDIGLNNLRLESIKEQVQFTNALAAAEKGVGRETLKTIQAVQSAIGEAQRRERGIGAQIDAARQVGGDKGEQEAARLVDQQKLAANETRLELEKGALSLKEAGEQLRDNIREGVLEFTRVRSDPQGLNRFLNSQQIQQRAERDFQTLLPSFREAQGRFTQLTGARAPEFSGSTSGVNESIRNFIESVSREFDSTKDLNATYAAANKINSELVSVNTQLAQVTQALADKNWLVNVAVSGGQAAAYGDVLNGALSA